MAGDPEAVADVEQIQCPPLEWGGGNDKPEAGLVRVGGGDSVEEDGGQVG